MKSINLFLAILLGLTFFVASCGDDNEGTNKACSASNLNGTCENADEYCKEGTCVLKEITCDPECKGEQVCIAGTCEDTTKEVNCKDNAPDNAESTVVKVTVTYDEVKKEWSEPTDCEWECVTNYKKNDDQTACIEGQEEDPCDNMACENGVCSDGVCTCNDFYELNADKTTCLDIDECLTNNGGCDANFYTCKNNEGAVPTCVDIDECLTDNGGCDANFYTCKNNEGAVPTCLDIDECLTNNGGCDANFYTCKNNEGAEPTCVDIDECLTDNGGCDANFYTCKNNEGAVPTCVDIDECLTDNGGCDANFYTCKNNEGAVPTCVDIDECLTNNGGCDANFYTCKNNEGAVPTCVDIDECLTNNGGCDANFYTCKNNEGAVPTCVDIDECSDADLNDCNDFADCTNKEMGFTCSCKEGYEGDGIDSCVEVCGNGIQTLSEECDEGIETADCNADCTLTLCGDGYINTTANEGCDDNNTDDGDGCSALCKLEEPAVCGDGIVQVGEDCDTNGFNTVTCNGTMCTTSECGDGYFNEIAEECDGQGFCNADCTTDWSCDLGFYGSDDGCDCGCGMLDPDCDDETMDACEWVNNAGSCTNGAGIDVIKPDENWLCLNFCGDGIKQDSEECDEGGDTLNCNANCTVSACGDGYLNPNANETCDDGNTDSGDGCDDSCQIEIPAEWTCNTSNYGTGNGCDCGCGATDPDCADTTKDSCNICGNTGSCAEDLGCDVIDPNDNSMCIVIVCGNGTVEPTETCDDGNTDNGDGCDENCQFEVPAEWTCDPDYYGNGVVCQCGCGAIDPDCADETIDSCEACNFSGSCAAGGSDCSAIDPNDNSICLPTECGNDIVELGEECDGTSLNGKTCSDLGFNDGTLACAATCVFDTSDCTAVPAEWTCTPGFYGDSFCDCGCGVIDIDCSDNTSTVCTYCNDSGSCAEGSDCSAINPGDNSICLATECGNNIVESGEECDGTSLNGKTCSDLGFNDGTLACAATCVFDTSACTGTAVPAEWTCNSGFYAANDGCDCGCGAIDPDCADETSASCLYCNGSGSCTGGAGCDIINPDNNSICSITSECGNNIIEDGEVCDGTSLNAQTCSDLGYTGGTLACTVACIFDTSACTGTAVPAEWTCDPSYYNDTTCDCGCGVLDIDCSDSTSDVCFYCGDQGSCAEGSDCSQIAPNENWQCQ